MSHSLTEESKREDKSGSCCSTGGGGRRQGAPAVERHTRGRGKEVGDDEDEDERRSDVEEWREGKVMDLDDELNKMFMLLFCFFMLTKCYEAPGLGLLTSASLVPEGSLPSRWAR